MSQLIAIEGIDGSGKGTQAARLRDALCSEGLSVALLSFPRYQETRFGQAIGRFLNGDFGSLDSVHPQLAAVLFAGDRFESREVVHAALKDHDVVLCDRYVASNLAHQAAKLAEPARSELAEWIQSIEFDVFGLPRPDLTLLLDLPATTAQELIAQKSARTYTEKAADLQEADADYLERVRHVYRMLAETEAGWRLISVTSGNRIRPLDEITGEMMRIASKALTFGVDS